MERTVLVLLAMILYYCIAIHHLFAIAKVANFGMELIVVIIINLKNIILYSIFIYCIYYEVIIHSYFFLLIN